MNTEAQHDTGSVGSISCNCTTRGPAVGARWRGGADSVSRGGRRLFNEVFLCGGIEEGSSDLFESSVPVVRFKFSSVLY